MRLALSLPSRRSLAAFLYYVMRVLLFTLLLICLLLIFSVRPNAQEPTWETLTEARITYYGPRYVAGDVTASGMRYAPDNDTVALGPDLLQAVRDHYGPFSWWEDNQRLHFVGAGGCYPIREDLDIIAWWGCLVRICAGGHCGVFRVADTGKPNLDVDLPDETWLRFGYPASQGVFTGTVEVLVW